MFIALSKVRLITALGGGGGTTPIIIKGPWNADTNVPFLQSSVGTPGDAYIVSVAGTTNLDGVTDWQVLDIAIFGLGVWSKIDRSPIFPLVPDRVLITDGAGSPATSNFLKFNSVTGLLEPISIDTLSITSRGSARIFAFQNTVNANRDLTAEDLGATLSAGTPGHTISLPAFGILNKNSSFSVAQFTADSLTVSATAPTTLNGVIGGSFVTPGVNTLAYVVRNGAGAGTDDWFYYIVSEEGSVPTYNEIYSNDLTANTNIVAGKPLIYSSTTEGVRPLPVQTEAQFSANPNTLSGLRAWISTNEREVHRRFGGTVDDEVAYLTDIAAIEEDAAWGELYFNNNSLPTVIVTQGAAVKVNSLYLADELLGFTHDGTGGLIYTEPTPRTVAITGFATCSFNGSLGTVSVSVAKNNLVINKTITKFDLSAVSPNFIPFSRIFLIPVSQNDKLELFIQNDTGTENITVQSGSLIPHSMGGSNTGQNIDLNDAYANGDGSIQMTDDKPIVAKSTIAGQKRGQVFAQMPSAEFAGIPAPLLAEAAVTTDEVAGATRMQMRTLIGGVPSVSSLAFLTDLVAGGNVVISWDGSTTPVPVTAGVNVDITGGVISVPGYGADTSQVIVSNSTDLSNIIITRSFITKKGLLTNVQMEITCQFNGFLPTIEFTLPFITAFSPVLDLREIFGTCEVIDWLGQGSNATPGGMLGQVEPIPGTFKALFTIRVGGTITGLPNPGKLRFDFTYRNFPI